MHINEQVKIPNLYYLSFFTDSCTNPLGEQTSAWSALHVFDHHRVRNICDSGMSVPVNPLQIVLNGRHLKINVHHFMWTTGGCHDNQACFHVKGGQLSLCQQGGRKKRMKGKGGMGRKSATKSKGGRNHEERGYDTTINKKNYMT